MFVFSEVLVPVFLLCVTIQLGYALYFFAQIFTVTNRKSEITHHSYSLQPVSVIICAKNEAHNLQRNLPPILAQRYANEAGNALYEVIVVNDASSDNTHEVLVRMARLHTNLHVMTIATDEKRDKPGKKYALSKAIAAAKYGFILMIDADCMPVSENWLVMMVQSLHEGKAIVAGYGKYRQENSMLNTFIRWETLHTFLQYASYAIVGMPYMAVGRNLACTKEAMQKAQQTPVWNLLPSGDDDLLVRTQATADNIVVVAAESAFTLSDAKTTWGDWLKQKQRHTSTGKYYDIRTQLLLGMYALSHALSWLLFFVLIGTAYWQLALWVMLCRAIVYWSIWYRCARILNEKNIAIWFPLMDIGWMLYNFVLSPYIFLKNKQHWN